MGGLREGGKGEGEEWETDAQNEKRDVISIL